MKPSCESGVVAVLNTVAECKIILAAIDDHAVPNPPLGPTWDDLRQSTIWRFRVQTQHEPRPEAARSYEDMVWNKKPEFRVEPQDVAFIKTAAERALCRKNLADRLFSRTSRRQRAARRILKGLETGASHE